MGVVTVHVVDDVDERQHQDFHCEIRLLTAHMKYFTPFMQHMPGQDVELSVKCSLQTFAWLMAYVKRELTGITPVMDSSNCMAILIASNFLKMAQLLKEAAAFIAMNILQLAATASIVENITRLEGGLLTQVANAIRDEVLEALLQHHSSPQQCSPSNSSSDSEAGKHTGNTSSSSINALVQKLYKHKLEALLKEHQTTLMRCRVCQQLFSVSSHSKLQCPVLAGAATERLKALPLHQPDPTWRFQDFLQEQRRPQQQQQQQPSPHLQPGQQQDPRPIPWKDLFWLTWGHVTVLYCQKCSTHFPARQYNHCSYHPLAADFANEVEPGVYSCCGRPAWLPGVPLSDSQGCTAAQHQVICPKQLSQELKATKQNAAGKQFGPTQADSIARAVELLEGLGGLITVPYTPPPLIQQAAPANKQTPQHTSAAAGTGGTSRPVSSSSSTGFRRPTSREAGAKLPLLINRSNRATSSASGTGSAETSNRQSPRQLLPPLSLSSSAGIRGMDGSDSATSGANIGIEMSLIEEEQLGSAPKQRQQLVRYNEAHTASVTGKGDTNGDDDHLSDELDFRSAHLSSFMEAVRSAAQARNRTSSFLGVSATSAARVAAEMGVPLQATFSEGGTARRMSQTTGSGGPSRSRAISRQATTTTQGLMSQQLSSLYSSKNADGIIRAADKQVLGLGAVKGTQGRTSGSGGKMGITTAVNRTLLLELMHEDDVYRMGLLMRKLDTMRVQPPPDGVISTLQPLSAEQVATAVNATLFKGCQQAK